MPKGRGRKGGESSRKRKQPMAIKTRIENESLASCSRGRTDSMNSEFNPSPDNDLDASIQATIHGYVFSTLQGNASTCSRVNVSV